MERMNRDEAWYDLVLKERAGIEVALLSRDILEVDYQLFRPVISLDDFLEGYNDVVLFKPLSPYKIDGSEICERGRLVLEKRWGAQTRGLDEYLSLLDLAFQKCVEAGTVAIKSWRAYERTILYERVSRAEAEWIFAKKDQEVTHAEAQAFGDFMMHEIVKRCIEYDLPLQIHTGIQSGGGNLLANANPLLLNNLFLEYPEAKFIIFHGVIPGPTS